MATQEMVIIEANCEPQEKALFARALALSIPVEKVIVRLDGLYGNGAPLRDVLGLGLAVIGRSKEYSLLDLPQVQAILSQPPAQKTTHPESGISRALFDCPAIPLGRPACLCA